MVVERTIIAGVKSWITSSQRAEWLKYPKVDYKIMQSEKKLLHTYKRFTLDLILQHDRHGINLATDKGMCEPVLLARDPGTVIT